MIVLLSVLIFSKATGARDAGFIPLSNHVCSTARLALVLMSCARAYVNQGVAISTRHARLRRPGFSMFLHARLLRPVHTIHTEPNEYTRARLASSMSHMSHVGDKIKVSFRYIILKIPGNFFGKKNTVFFFFQTYIWTLDLFVGEIFFGFLHLLYLHPLCVAMKTSVPYDDHHTQT